MGTKIDSAALARRVREARERMGWNQTELAQVAGVSQPTVSRIETEKRDVTLADADLLAQALSLPLDTLLYGSRVAERVLISLRVAGGNSQEDAAVAAGVELLELDERLDDVTTEHRQRPVDFPVAPQSGGTPTTQGEQLAADLRSTLEIGTGPVADLFELIEEITGVDVASRPLPGLSGMCLLDPARQSRLLVVNSDEPAERQRFSLAHELGHLLFGDGAHLDALNAPATEAETRCNEFARNLLAPRNGVASWLRRVYGEVRPPVGEEAVSRLARYFGVSAEVIRIQLERSGLRPGPVPSTPALASKFGWRLEYDANQVAARRQRPPRRLVQRATEACRAGLLGIPVLAALEGRPLEDLEAEQGSHDRPAADSGPVPAPEGLADLDELLALTMPAAPGRE